MNIIETFCKKNDFPKDATEYLSETYDIFLRNEECREIYSKCIDAYKSDFDFDSEPIFDEIEKMGKVLGIKPYTLDLLYLISLTPHLKELYDERNIDDDVYESLVFELKSKNRECYDVYGYYGTFVGWWTIGFFKLKRFGFGRLQFNKRRFDRDIESGGFSFKKGDLYLDVHIPSGKPLDHDECMTSYNKAYDFFKKDFNGDPVIFGCHSWLMSSNNPRMLPPKSNILKFMSDYTVAYDEKDEKNLNLWRVFNTFEMPENADDLPQDTTVRKAVAEWLKKGNTIDVGFGIMIMP